ncbi:MAG: arginine--tRNA ligase [Candidatus Fraserbacteria bacterium RBG_16_55_9]|uniref:Arginine--tRNA ligase n=1 Tax=Fraserbacteria sp. (strain RBG_16_55_9) TaxID=1817864 RepID=A0A1F5UNJ3_FRAXR|nr:MAG: arginine--tRNA ligase [Candidatus Fraserbacteria bacterium RBG_16_55_9]
MNLAVREIAERASGHLGLPPQEIYPLITSPPDEGLGDYALPCFAFAQKLRRSPAEIAKELADVLRGGQHIVNAESAGPYVNITVDRAKLMQYVLSGILSGGENYGRESDGAGKTIVIDYSSPNIARPFSIAHLRSTALGNSLKRIYEHLGYRVVGVNHLGDWGVQFGTLIAAYNRWGSQERVEQDSIYELFRLYVRFNEESERDPMLKEEARAWFKRLEDGDPEALKLWKWFVDESVQAFQRYYELLGVEFTEIRGESAYRDQMAPLIEDLLQKGIAKESQGAIVIPFEEEGLTPLIIRTKDGTTVYATRDLCSAIHHYEKYGFHKKLYVVDAGQSLHFKQLALALGKLGYPWATGLVHVPFGVMLFEDQRMSTRRGHVVFLEEVLKRSIELTRSIIDTIKKSSELTEKEKEQVAQDVGVSAIVYADLSRSRTHDINFRWDEVLNFNGQSGPYVQYTHARLAGVLRKYGKSIPSELTYSLLSHPQEISLAKCLEEFPMKVKHAAEEYEPFVVAGYLGNLAASVNQFYDNCRVLGEEPSLEEARIALVYSAKIVLKKGLELLGMKAPERM